ncbi:MAG: preprotein translocase subunit YajC [bacterium]
MIGIVFAQNGSGTTAQPTGGMGMIGSLLPLILIFVVLYFLMILPQQRRQKKHQQMIANLKKGDRVVFASGILGVITSIKENTFMVKVSEETEVEVEKGAIAYKLGSSSQ